MGGTQLNSVTVKYGVLSLKTIALEVPAGRLVEEATVKLDDQLVSSSHLQDGTRVTLELQNRITAGTG